MAEEFPDYNSFFIFPKDHRNQRPENVITKPHSAIQPKNTNQVGCINVHDQRKIETEKFTQKSLPNLKQSYGTVYPSRKSYAAESEPLLNKNYHHHYPDYLYGEPVQLTRYRRTQIFLFFYIVFYVSYLIIGSICFQQLETGIEQEIRDEFRDVRRKFLKENPSLKG